jgi:GH15 family glucan-1,4-alpha-glucosidase
LDAASFRLVEVLSGEVSIEVDIRPRGGAAFEPISGGFDIDCRTRPGLRLHFASESPFEAFPQAMTLRAGQRLLMRLRWQDESHRFQPMVLEDLLENTRRAWRAWLGGFAYAGPQRDLVLRSAITLKLLNHLASGAIIAAPTSSLPEAIGGVRNWDYRYAWIRDAAFSVYALRRVGLTNEASRFLSWVLDSVERDGRPRVLYDIDGAVPPPEWEDSNLEGYRRSRPVRWGNAAAEQRQHDVFGEIIDCAYQWTRWGGQLDGHLWGRLKEFVDAARTEWLEPDHGIWEVRTPGRPFTYSAALCQVALDRGATLAERFGLPGDRNAWRAEARRIKAAILEGAWDESLGAITEHIGGGALDASALALPLRRVIPADHPRMVSTTAAVQRELGAGKGLLYRYLPEKSPDGIQGHEGAFLLCSFWLVDNLAGQGKLDEALDLYDSLCSRAGPLGLLPEQVDPATGAYLGNYPQAFSHVGVISSGINLHRLLQASKDSGGNHARE